MTPPTCMTATLESDKIRPVQTENPWQRLHRIADARRKHLHLTVDGLRGAGGPSAPWFYKLKYEEGPVSNRHIPFLEKLDAALQWPLGTSAGLLDKDRSDWSAVVLDDEEAQLVEYQDEVAFFAFMVERRLRTLDPDAREQLMRDIGRMIGLPVLGD